jgi:hypothetical protein
MPAQTYQLQIPAQGHLSVFMSRQLREWRLRGAPATGLVAAFPNVAVGARSGAERALCLRMDAAGNVIGFARG